MPAEEMYKRLEGSNQGYLTISKLTNTPAHTKPAQNRNIPITLELYGNCKLTMQYYF